jgi:hypothetical protein
MDGGGDILSFPSLALSRSGSEGISHPRIALRLAGPLACATLRQRADYTPAAAICTNNSTHMAAPASKPPNRTMGTLTVAAEIPRFPKETQYG